MSGYPYDKFTSGSNYRAQGKGNTAPPNHT